MAAKNLLALGKQTVLALLCTLMVMPRIGQAAAGTPDRQVHRFLRVELSPTWILTEGRHLN